MKASAIAHSNIALIKYWGRSSLHNPQLNIPLNDTVSMTKCGLTDGIKLQTHTTIEFSDNYKKDTVILDGKILKDKEIVRILRVVNFLRKQATIDYKFKIVSKNDFPTQAGLASSASGFAALAVAASHALTIHLPTEKISTIARLGSGSAARSIHGGFVYCFKGNSHETAYAEQICDSAEFKMNAVIAIVDDRKKEITSDEGHEFAHSSPFNEIRIKKSQDQAKEIRQAIIEKDFSSVGQLAEDNCKYMHAVMMTSNPPLFYWNPDTLRIIKAIQQLRKHGLECYFSIDAGPNVHCLCRENDRSKVKKIVEKMEGVKKTVLVKPAEDSFITEEHLF